MHRHQVYVVVVAGALVVGWYGAAYAQSSESIVKLPKQIEFKAPVKGSPQVALLYGDPTKPGLFVQRIKFPAGFKILPHWHPDEARTAVVLSGTLYFGLGEKWDESKMKAYPAGTFFSEPPKTPHFAWAKDGEVIVQVSSIGPTGTTFVQQPSR